MNIAFFHTGIDTSKPEMLCRSAKKIFKGEELKLIQLTDDETPKVKSANQILRIRGLKQQSIMKGRMIAYKDYLKTFQEPTVFLDTDMLITNRFSVDLSKGPVLCKREYNLDMRLKSHAYKGGKKLIFPEHSCMKLGEIFPYVGCFFADKSEAFLEEALKIYETLDQRYKFWFGDQIALKEAASSNPFSTVSEKLVACDPLEYLEYLNPAAILHFKGAKLKPLMKEFFNKMHASRNIVAPTSYRSNPNKPGYEIAKTYNPYFKDYLGKKYRCDDT